MSAAWRTSLSGDIACLRVVMVVVVTVMVRRRNSRRGENERKGENHELLHALIVARAVAFCCVNQRVPVPTVYFPL